MYDVYSNTVKLCYNVGLLCSQISNELLQQTNAVWPVEHQEHISNCTQTDTGRWCSCSVAAEWVAEWRRAVNAADVSSCNLILTCWAGQCYSLRWGIIGGGESTSLNYTLCTAMWHTANDNICTSRDLLLQPSSVAVVPFVGLKY